MRSLYSNANNFDTELTYIVVSDCIDNEHPKGVWMDAQRQGG